MVLHTAGIRRTLAAVAHMDVDLDIPIIHTAAKAVRPLRTAQTAIVAALTHAALRLVAVAALVTGLLTALLPPNIVVLHHLLNQFGLLFVLFLHLLQLIFEVVALLFDFILQIIGLTHHLLIHLVHLGLLHQVHHH
ncbi:hypothetical protein [Leisingera sp. S232]|uniref:hypothetical protein n=1 Tax=Leisingera sp. S232 TaxID=3415132 RepID=UPI003C7C864F